MVYYCRENAVQTHPPSQVQVQVDRDLVMYTAKDLVIYTERFGYVDKVKLVYLSRQNESRRNEV